jgi:hypothetical protein
MDYLGSILHLQGLLIPDVEQAILEQGRVLPVPLVVPADVERRFQAAAEKFHPEIRIPGNFPLQAGADAFVTHWEESTKRFTAGNFLNERTPQPKQYLSLLKCIWIMKGIQESNGLRNAPQNSQWQGYIDQLNEDLSNECQRFAAPSAHRLIAPELNSVRGDDEYNIWHGENIAQYISPHTEKCLEEVLNIPMPSPSESVHRDMTIYRLGLTTYRLVESVEDKTTPSTTRQDFKLDVDLKTVTLTPLYATPSSRPKSLEVLITSGSTQTNPTFQDHKHILRLQHLLTGYKVYEHYDQAMVTVSFFISGQATPVEEHGRLQLWLPHPFFSSSTSASVASSSIQSPTHGSRASLSNAMESMTIGNSRDDVRVTPSRLTNRSSQTSVNTAKGSIPPGIHRENIAPSRFSVTSSAAKLKRRASSVMTSSSSASRSTVSSITTISTGTGKAHLHAKPAKPLFVILLKSRDASAKLAITAIQLDDKTEVKRERCGCRTSNSQCRVSCIERSGGHLLVQRWDADQGLGSWNLARLGVEQRKELPEDEWNDIKRVSISFQSLEGMLFFVHEIITILLLRKILISTFRPLQIQR